MKKLLLALFVIQTVTILVLVYVLLRRSSVDSTESSLQTDKIAAEDKYDASNDVYDFWLGTLFINGTIYRLGETQAVLILEKKGVDTYVGKLNMFVGSTEIETGRFYPENGRLEGKVRAKSNGNELLVTMVEAETYAGDIENHFEGDFVGESQIFKITYNNGNYTTVPIGKMEHYYDGGDITTKK